MGTVLDREALVSLRQDLRTHHKSVVFTNGCFDLLHRGHVEYLTSARSLGDILIVGINSDASVRKIKDPRRPIMPEADRAFIIASLAVVDFVCLFDEDTPLELIQQLVPDTLVKGADWNIDSVVGKDIVEAAGGKVSTIPFVTHCSTSDIITRILKRFSQ